MDPKELRERTRSEHEATEALLPLGHAGLRHEEYVRGLRALAPVVASWERWAGAEAPADLRPLVEARQRTAWIESDLRRLEEQDTESGQGGWQTATEGVSWPEVMGEVLQGVNEGSQAVHEEAFRAAFLGAMYVMEGSTLGGRYLAKHVLAELGESIRPATLYFQGHGERTGTMWREMVAVLTAVPDAYAELTVSAAKATFRAFGEALRRSLGDRESRPVLTSQGEGASE